MHVKRMIRLLLLLTLLAPLAVADDAYDGLEKAWTKARTDWSALRKQSAGNLESLPPYPAIEYMQRFRAYAEQHAGTAEALPALLWLIREGDSVAKDAPDYPVVWALEQISKNHTQDPRIADDLRLLRYYVESVPWETVRPFYEQIVKGNPDRSAGAWAKYNLVHHDYENAQAADSSGQSPELKPVLESLRAIAKDYDGTDPAKYAASLVYEIEHLQVGMKAPEIIGPDAAGNEIKLSQFRGKVVALAFWGYW